MTENTEQVDKQDKSTKISIEDFFKIELIVGEILSVSEVPKSKKLLCLQVNLGEAYGVKQILAGIAGHYEFSELVGRKIVVVANLQPATLMELESQGMLLASSVEDRVVLLDPDNRSLVGTRVR
jgi:methionyl-tRNA synthetase